MENNRIVANASGTVVQRNSYYQFGMSYGEESVVEQGKQPYKYNGKELDKMHGLNQYDSEARFYDPSMIRTPTPDPHAENYYAWSPYAWVANNPLRLVDPDGKDWKEALNKFKQSVSVSFSLGLQAGLVLAVNNKEAELNINVSSMDFGGISEGENNLNFANPAITQEFAVEVGNYGVSFDKRIEETSHNTTEKTTTFSANIGFVEGTVSTQETFTKDKNGSYSKIGETTKNKSIDVKNTTQDITTTFGGSVVVGVEAEINWNKVAQGVKEVIKSVSDIWK